MKILLTTLHAKYSHASLALPYIASSCNGLSGVDVVVREWTVNEPREHILRLVMAEKAELVAFSCYIWNIELTLKIVSDIKKISPETIIVLGGPEVSFAIFDLMQENPAVDFVVKGEGEEVFRKLAVALAGGGDNKSLSEIENLFFRYGEEITSGLLNRDVLELDSLPSPFLAGSVDLTKPLVYYETSRGCPFSCAFCLSSVEGAVRSFGIDRIRADLLYLMDSDVAQIKFVDRTFNYDSRRADVIWKFILENNRCSHFHFEIAADLLTDSNINLLSQVPENSFRFEIGIQSSSSATLQRVARVADLDRITSNIRRLKAETRVDLHLDLVAGLPGEDYKGFLDSLQMVAGLKPDMLQIEPLKVLKGAPMRAIANKEGYSWSEAPPYMILRNPWLSFDEICKVETIGRLLDLFGKHGGFGSAFRVLQQFSSFADIMDKMACRAGNENLSSFSCRRVFELFSRLSEPVPDLAVGEQLKDALFFDYCQVEMPVSDKLPLFAADKQELCSWLRQKELTKEIGEFDIPDGSRVKAFSFKFMRDYRLEKWDSVPFTAVFIYVSTAGQRLKIEIKSSNSPIKN
ncbi:MAG: DUF4080 domain-containing protein [Desulfuromonadaceae bacterium]|nr:DUF4080 domain-containing protein [Desulfuromonadaceae bacterium]MDD2854532.1 DUF4080 domain-containing protein [Desulfuromonadaceae bacterium]